MTRDEAMETIAAFVARSSPERERRPVADAESLVAVLPERALDSLRSILVNASSDSPTVVHFFWHFYGLDYIDDVTYGGMDAEVTAPSCFLALRASGSGRFDVQRNFEGPFAWQVWPSGESPTDQVVLELAGAGRLVGDLVDCAAAPHDPAELEAQLGLRAGRLEARLKAPPEPRPVRKSSWISRLLSPREK